MSHLTESVKVLCLESAIRSHILESVKAFYLENEIDIPNLEALYTSFQDKACRQVESLTILEHHFKVDIFYATIGCQLHELNNIFCDQALELLILSSSLNPKNAYNSFKVDDICKLV